MKKVLALALGMLLIPFTAFGMQTMDEAAMDSVTGQSGVAISVDNVGIYSSGETTWYQGGAEDSNTWFGITGGDEITRIDLSAAPTADLGDFDAEAYDGFGDPSALMIETSDDVFQDTALSGEVEVQGVLITLGTLEIRSYTGEEATIFGVFDAENAGDLPTIEGADDFDHTYGRIATDGGVTRILGGQVMIMPKSAYEEAAD